MRGCSYITRKGVSWVQSGSSFSLTAASELSRAPAPQWCADGETEVYPVRLLSLAREGLEGTLTQGSICRTQGSICGTQGSVPNGRGNSPRKY